MDHTTSNTTWELIESIARDKGAKYPELVAAQWALESGYGKYPAAKNNFWGLKATGNQSSSNKSTYEEINGKRVQIKADFINFDTVEAGVEYLVKLWYKNYKSYRGVNNALNVESAALMLKEMGYATDSKYPDKLLKILATKVPKAIPEPESVMRITAVRDTVLKKAPVQSGDLDENQLARRTRGTSYEVMKFSEIPMDSHAEVELAYGAGTWYIFEPHWSKDVGGPPEGDVPINWTDFDFRVTPNLTVGEILQWDKRRIPRKGSAQEREVLKTAKEYQKIRVAWGRPLGVTSFYRPEPINSQVGGVRGSQHTLGKAIDIYPIHSSLTGFYQWIRQRWTGALGDGRPRGFIHLDTRSGGHFVPGGGVRPITEWNY